MGRKRSEVMEGQLGFSFEAAPPPEVEVVIQFPTAEVVEDPPEFDEEIVVPAIETETPALFSDLEPVEREQEVEIPWRQYVRMVQLYFNQEQHENFRAQVSKLALRYGTKSVTDTVFTVMQKAAEHGAD